LLLAGVAVFQFGLAMGTPWGDMAYGGRALTESGVLPNSYRVVSLVSAVVLLLAAWVVLARAAAAPTGPLSAGFLRWAIWVVFGFLVLNTFSNLASQSNAERWVMGSITLIAAILCLIVARKAPG